MLLWKFFKGENPGDSRGFLQERFNAYIGELNDCAKRKAFVSSLSSLGSLTWVGGG